MRYCRAPADKKGAGGRIAACNLCGRRAGAAPVRSGGRVGNEGPPSEGTIARLPPPAWGTRLRAPAPSGCARGLQGRGWGFGGWTVVFFRLASERSERASRLNHVSANCSPHLFRDTISHSAQTEACSNPQSEYTSHSLHLLPMQLSGYFIRRNKSPSISTTPSSSSVIALSNIVMFSQFLI